MNARYLAFTVFILFCIGLTITSKSTLTPERGADQVFTGEKVNHFIGQEIQIGDFDGDGKDDVVSTLKWDDPSPGGAELQFWDSTTVCTTQILSDWKITIAYTTDPNEFIDGQDTVNVCEFSGSFGDEHWAYWEEQGWDTVSTGGECDSCYSYHIRGEDQGAAYVFMGGDLTATPCVVPGKEPKDLIYNGFAAGNVNFNDEGGTHYDDLVIGAPQNPNVSIGKAGVVYVIHGGSSWPDTIDLEDPAYVKHTFIGRDADDAFGLGIAVGDLDGDGNDDIVVAAPGSESLNNGGSNSGEVYIFFSNDSLPATVDLSVKTDAEIRELTRFDRSPVKGIIPLRGGYRCPERDGPTHVSSSWRRYGVFSRTG